MLAYKNKNPSSKRIVEIQALQLTSLSTKTLRCVNLSMMIFNDPEVKQQYFILIFLDDNALRQNYFLTNNKNAIFIYLQTISFPLLQKRSQ